MMRLTIFGHKRIVAAVFLFLMLLPGLSHAAFTQKQGCEIYSEPGICDGAPIPLFYWLPEKLASETSILFVCHGVKRNPEKYLKDWKAYADQLNVILIAPGFMPEHFPKGRNYNQGYIVDEKGKVNPPERWSYSAIERIFSFVKSSLGLTSEKFVIYGHSAGAQFVHRMMIFLPQTSAGLAIAANPGSLTFLNSQEKYPYGLKNPSLSETEFKRAFSRKLVLMLGMEDTDPNDKNLNKSKRAQKQGKFRLERGRNFFAAATEVANRINAQFNWEKIEIPGVGHSNKGMAKAAVAEIQKYLAGISTK